MIGCFVAGFVTNRFLNHQNVVTGELVEGKSYSKSPTSRSIWGLVLIVGGWIFAIITILVWAGGRNAQVENTEILHKPMVKALFALSVILIGVGIIFLYAIREFEEGVWWTIAWGVVQFFVMAVISALMPKSKMVWLAFIVVAAGNTAYSVTYWPGEEHWKTPWFSRGDLFAWAGGFILVMIPFMIWCLLIWCLFEGKDLGFCE